MKKSAMLAPLVCLLIAPAALAQVADRVELGKLPNGSSVTFARDGAEWGLDISGGTAPQITQPKPAQIEIYRAQNAVDVAAGYQSVQKEGDGVVAKARVTSERASFDVEDHWKISGGALTLDRKLSVAAAEDNAGFYSAIKLLSASSAKWQDASTLVPGLNYGNTGGGGGGARAGVAATAPGGRRYQTREDTLSAPMISVMFQDGAWAAVLDMSPKGDTIAAEAGGAGGAALIDQRMLFGAMGAQEATGGGAELGFWLPGSTTAAAGGRGGANGRLRYHPVKAGFSQSYQVAFRFGKSATFPDMERETWRWAWDTLKPKATPIDIELTRKALADHLADRVVVVDDRAGVPFVIDAVSGRPGSYRASAARPAGGGGPLNEPAADSAPLRGGRGGGNPAQFQDLADWAKGHGILLDPNAAELDLWPMIMMGFCGKNVEVADQLLQESDRDPGPRGQRMRKLGMTIIDGLVRIIPMNPAPAAEGFDIRTGKASGLRGGASFSLRAMAEDMRTAMDMYVREKKAGRDHPDWFKWVKGYCDWQITVQRDDGSFPEGYAGSTGRPTSNSSVCTYAPIPVLAKMTDETKDKKYLDSALKAGEFLWTAYGSKGVYQGATGGEAVDKESGMLSTEAFLALYESTRDARWLDRAQSAGSYTESWIWIWNVPMPVDTPDASLGWKHGVSTIGSNGIAANVPGEIDEYLAWAVPTYAKLYKYTKDDHYLDVARVILHGTKAMLAIPGRTYDLAGPGWQQEHWRMLGTGPRGIGAHRTWLPWISVNQLHGITGLEEFDKDLYQQLIKTP